MQELLAQRGHAVNQGTLSRDLRELRVRKGPDGYEVPENGRDTSPAGELAHAVREWLDSAAAAQNLAVLRTPPGGAQMLGLALDAAALPQTVGCIAGDDTIFVACKTPRAAAQVCRALLKMRGER